MNTITIAGHVGQDCELRHTPDGTAVASFSLASTRGTGDKKKTVWFRCTLWRVYAETMAPYILKGTALTAFGHIDLEPRVWQDKDGNYKAGIDVTADSVQLQGGRDSRDAAPDAGTQAPRTLDDVDDVPW